MRRECNYSKCFGTVIVHEYLSPESPESVLLNSCPCTQAGRFAPATRRVTTKWLALIRVDALDLGMLVAIAPQHFMSVTLLWEASRTFVDITPMETLVGSWNSESSSGTRVINHFRTHQQTHHGVVRVEQLFAAPDS